MMKARKCDRCGEFYLFENNHLIYLTSDNGLDTKNIDLCPDCYEELNRYLIDPNTIVCDVNGGNEDE